MRPRVIPAEDITYVIRIRIRKRTCFNEAAGYPRGRPQKKAGEEAKTAAASMRPRVIPAEDWNRIRKGFSDGSVLQ